MLVIVWHFLYFYISKAISFTLCVSITVLINMRNNECLCALCKTRSATSQSVILASIHLSQWKKNCGSLEPQYKHLYCKHALLYPCVRVPISCCKFKDKEDNTLALTQSSAQIRQFLRFNLILTKH